MNRQDIIDRLKKIKSLSEKGVGGEKDSAERHLEELMRKYGITEEDLNEEETAVERFFNACENMNLFAQIVGKIFGKESRRFKRKIKRDYRLYFTDNGELGDVDFTNSVVCTRAEFVEIKFVYETYLADYKKQLDIFFYAYLEKNDLLMPCDEEKEPTREEKEIAYKAGMMANGIDRKIINKAIDKE